jgi:myo-inositol-1(or 4)-monophosphatase
VTQQAVVYDPNRDELFTATRGAGAYVNNRRLRVAGRTKMSEALIGTGFPYREDQDVEAYLEIFAQMTRQCAGLRRPGAASLDLAYVAAGRLDGFFEQGLKPWDMAAGALLITEAGGLVGNYAGEESYLNTGEIMAANPRIFGQMVNILRNHSKVE